MSRRPYTDGGSERSPSNQSYEVSYDLDREELPSVVVVRAVATLTDTPPLDLDPLYDVIDPNCLDRLVQKDDESTAQIEVTFTFSGCEVTIRGDQLYVQTLGNSG